MLYEFRKCEPNIRIEVPGWPEPCLDVLGLPGRCLNDQDGYYRLPKDGPLGKAATTLRKAYHRHLTSSKITVHYSNGYKETQDSLGLDDEVLVGRIFGSDFDGVMRAAFARCVELLGANPEEIIAEGERIYRDHIASEAARKAAKDAARARVDAAHERLLSPYMADKVKDAFFKLMTDITIRTGRVPAVSLSGGEPFLAVVSLEHTLKRRIPRGHKLEGMRKMSGQRFLSLHGLALLGFGLLRDWYFEDEDNDAISSIHGRVLDLQYQMLNSTREGRQVLDGMIDGLFGTGTSDSLR